MKLNAAAVLVLSLVVFLFSGVAFALDGIDLSNPPEAAEDEACSRLHQIKYPFLPCGGGEVGSPGEDPTWENTRRLPYMSDFTEGDGYWGPDLHE
jgi:hypothetical protein